MTERKQTPEDIKEMIARIGKKVASEEKAKLEAENAAVRTPEEIEAELANLAVPGATTFEEVWTEGDRLFGEVDPVPGWDLAALERLVRDVFPERNTREKNK